jgi:hypothetical protein
MLPQNLNWGALSENVSQVALDVKSKVEADTRQKYILIAAGFVGAALFLIIMGKIGR